MKIPGKLSAVLFSVWSLCAYAAEPEDRGVRYVPLDSSARYFVVGSSDRESGARAVALVDQVSWELIILSDRVGDPSLREVARHDYNPAVIDLTTMRVRGNRNLVIVSYSSEPIGNRTTVVAVYDATTGAKIFGKYSRTPAAVRDVTGDEQKELILYVDNQEFQIPYAPYVPVVYYFDGEEFVRHTTIADAKGRQFHAEAKQQFIAFRSKLQSVCREFEGGCPDFYLGGIEGASREIAAFEELERLIAPE